MPQHYTNPMIHKAFHELSSLSADEITRELAERREKALKDEAMFLEEAMKKGMDDKARQVAEVLLSMGDSIEKIAKATGLSPEEIRRIQSSKNARP